MADTQQKPTLPSAQTIAFAIAVVRSKPPELDIAGYIRLLGQHAAKGRRENALSAVHRHLDRSSYWYSEYERLRCALKVEQDKNCDLQREFDLYKSKAPETARSKSPVKKRKKPDEDVIPVPRSPKRLRQGNSLSPLDLDSSAEMAFGEAGEAGEVLLRSIYQIKAHVKAYSRAGPSDLAYHLVSATSSISQVVHQAVEQFTTEHDMDPDPLRTALVAAGRAVAFVLSGYTRLRQGAENTTGHVVYAIVVMFKDFLQDFQLLSAHGIKRIRAEEAQAAAAKSATSSKAKCKGNRVKAQNVKADPTLSMYTLFVEGILDKLDPKLVGNRDIFEGACYCTLQQIGDRLYKVTFGHSRGSDLEQEIIQGATTYSADDDAAGDNAQSPDDEHDQIKLEAPYLIRLLNHIMAAAPEHLGAANKTGRAKQGTNKSANKNNLVISAKECLQRTLINCTFGTEGMDEEDPFVESLKMPPAVEATLPMPKVRETDVLEHFTGEIWQRVGWEILTKDDKW